MSVLLSGLAPLAAQEALVPSACFARSFTEAELARQPDLAVRRVEVQFAQVKGAKANDAAARRVSIILTPRPDDLAPGGATARACTGTGQKLSCRFDCEGHGDGAFRTEPAGKDRIKLTLDGPIAVDACFDGVPAFEVPDKPANKTFVLDRVAMTDCSGAE